MKNIFEWIPRYSNTDEPDSSGRWARICIYKDLNIAWVKMVITNSGDRLFTINGNFPVSSNDMSGIVEHTKTFEEAQKIVEEEFEKFLNHVKRPYVNSRRKFFLSIKKSKDCILGFRGQRIGKYLVILRLFGKDIY